MLSVLLVGICALGVYVKSDIQVLGVWDSDVGCLHGALELDL